VRVVATAGHVDHGKSSLVLALTGTDPDRFVEEKARGLTIDLGFAFTTLPSGEDVGFVDVPGHERFVKNMLAGVGAVDVTLFVVAATEGWMPQSEEHLRILELLGVGAGMVAITKADLVDRERLEIVQLEISERLASSSLRAAPIVPTDSVTGRGIADVRTTLDALLAATPPPPDHDRPRLWIDRVFAARGSGTVVTGTLAGGSIALDDHLDVVRLDHSARVRGIETAHRSVERVAPGARVALNLAGIDRDALTRGDALVRADQWIAARAVDVVFTLLPDAPLRLPPRLRAAIGSGDHGVRARVLDAAAGFARLHFDTRLALAVGDRIVLRDPARARTIGGAIVLDVESSCPPATAPDVLRDSVVARLLASHGWLTPTQLSNLMNLDAVAVVDLAHSVVVGGRIAPRFDVDDLRRAVRMAVDAHHADLPLAAGLELGALATSLGRSVDDLRDALADDTSVVVEHGVVRDADRVQRASDTADGRMVIAQLDATPFSPPAPSKPAVARALVREGVVVDIEGILFTAAALTLARQRLRDALADGATLTVGQVRELLGSSRKYVVPLLGHLDREGFTRRRGDVRIAGPRIDQP